MRSLSQSSTSDSNHPTREGPSCTRLGNFPAASSRAICAGEYRTFSRTCLFDNIRIAMLPVGRRCNASVSQGATSITLPVADCVNPHKSGGSRWRCRRDGYPQSVINSFLCSAKCTSGILRRSLIGHVRSVDQPRIKRNECPQQPTKPASVKVWRTSAVRPKRSFKLTKWKGISAQSRR